MNTTQANTITVKFEIDTERLPALQGALAFLADVCFTYGSENDGSSTHKHFADALGYVTFLAAQIGEAALDQ